MGYSVKGKQGFQRTHGLTKHPLHNTWKRMKNRCFNPNNKDYKDYGAKGIIVCDEWATDFVAFYEWAMSHGWKQGLTIERKDFKGNYSPKNCEWIPMQEQSKNRCSVKQITYHGETHSITEWSRITGIARKTLDLRLKSPNFTLEEAFEKPVNKNLTRQRNPKPAKVV